MKRIHKTFIRSLTLAALATLLLSAPEAQARRGRHHDCSHLRQIDLDEEQKEAIRAIRKETRQQIREIRDDEELSREQKRDAMEAARDEQMSRIQEVLTDEQKQKIAELKAARKARKLAKKMERLTEALDLSDAQVSAITPILENAAQAKEEIKESDASREEKREELKALKNSTKEAIVAELTEEQAERFAKLSDRKRPGAIKRKRPGAGLATGRR